MVQGNIYPRPGLFTCAQARDRGVDEGIPIRAFQSWLLVDWRDKARQIFEAEVRMLAF